MPIIFPEEVQTKIVFVGLPKSGKTTLVRRLKDGDKADFDVTQTVGVAIELIEQKDDEGNLTQWLALDCGGQLEYAKAIWQPHTEAADAVVFLFDSTNVESVESTHHWLRTVLEWMRDDKKDTPLLFLANKSDLDNALSLKDVIIKLKLSSLQSERKSFGVYQISALKGENVDDAFAWFLERIQISKTV